MKAYLPQDIEPVTTEWLQTVIGDAFPGATLMSSRLAKAHSGTTGRARYELQWNNKTNQKPPHTVFVKLPPVDDNQKETVTEWGMGMREARFYKALSPELPVRTPISYFSNWNAEGTGYIMVMEDLRASGARPSSVKRDATLDTAQRLMDSLAKLHAAYWDSHRFSEDLSWLKPFQQVRSPELPYLAQQAFEGFAKEMPVEFSEAAQLFVNHAPDIADFFEKGTATLVHGDCHIGNLFHDADGTIGFLDWALCAKMPAMWDISYTLCNSFPTELRREHQVALLNRYLERFHAAGGPLRSFEEVWDDYRRFAFYAWLSPTVTVGAGDRMQNLANGLQGVRRANEALIDLDVLSLVGEELGL